MGRAALRNPVMGFLQDRYPCTTLLLGDMVGGVVRRAGAELAPTGLDAAVISGWFRRALDEAIAHSPDLLPYAVDVLAYEDAAAALVLGPDVARDAADTARRNAGFAAGPAAERRGLVPVAGAHVRVERFGFDVPAIVAAIEDCDRLDPVDSPAPCTVLLVVPPGADRPEVMRVSDGIRMILMLCNGTRTCAEVARDLRPTGADDLTERVLEALEALRERNVLSYA